MPFKSDKQRKYVMMLLKGDKRRSLTGFPEDQKKALRDVVERAGGKTQFEKLLAPSVKLSQLRKAGFYPQYAKGRVPKDRTYATWAGGTNRYLQHVAWNYHHPARPINTGEEIHHRSGDRRDNMKANLAKLSRAVHAAHGGLMKFYLRKPEYKKVPRVKLDTLVLKKAVYLVKKKRRQRG